MKILSWIVLIPGAAVLAILPLCASAGGERGAALKHAGIVDSAVFSPDGKRVVTASDDGTAQVWDAATGARIGPPLKHADRVHSAAFSPDGKRVVTASGDNTAQIWDAATGARIVPPLKHTGPVWSAAFSPNGKLVVTASDDTTAQIWDAATGARIGPPLKHVSSVGSAAFSPDGNRIVTVSGDTAQIWDTATREKIGAAQPPEGTVEHFCGTVIALVEAGCIGVNPGLGGKPYDITPAHPQPSIGALIEGTGRVDYGPNICMQGVRLSHVTWKKATACPAHADP